MVGITNTDMIVRVLVGAALGAVIGFERDRHGRHAGLRTHLIVGLASATFMLVSAHFYFFQGYTGMAGIAVDPSRIAASVVTGIGFLAGGAILKTGLTIQGLTTAAGLWLVAAIGLCAGAGMYSLALSSTLLGLLAMTVMRYFEDKPTRASRREVTLVLSNAEQPISDFFEGLRSRGIMVADFSYERLPNTPQIKLEFIANLVEGVSLEQFIRILEGYPGVQGVNVKLPL